jgi:hypothetical protein
MFPGHSHVEIEREERAKQERLFHSLGSAGVSSRFSDDSLHGSFVGSIKEGWGRRKEKRTVLRKRGDWVPLEG